MNTANFDYGTNVDNISNKQTNIGQIIFNLEEFEKEKSVPLIGLSNVRHYPKTEINSFERKEGYKNTVEPINYAITYSTRWQKNTTKNEVEKMNTLVTKAIFKPHGTTVATVCHNKEKSSIELDNLKIRETNGYMSRETSSKVGTMLEVWLKSLEIKATNNFRYSLAYAMKLQQVEKLKIKHLPVFITLTLPAQQEHLDQELKQKLLVPFIDKFLKRQKAVQQYFWRAEPQKNGNIHFHLLVDKFINHTDLRNEWNKYLDKFGYIENYRNNQLLQHKNGFTVCQKQLELFIEVAKHKHASINKSEETNIPFDHKKAKSEGINKQQNAYNLGIKNNFSSPNSTDIHAIYSLRSITAYVVKYTTKKGNTDETGKLTERKIEGKIWGSSDEIKNLNHFETDAFEKETSAYVDYLEENLTQKDIIHPKDKNEVELTYITTYNLGKTKQEEVLRSFFPNLYKRYSEHYLGVNRQLYG